MGWTPPALEGYYDCIFAWHFPVCKVLFTPLDSFHNCGKQAQQVEFSHLIAEATKAHREETRLQGQAGI